jgi:hypothetical protein
MSSLVVEIWQGRTLEQAIAGMTAFTLLICLAGLIVGGAGFAMGSALQSPRRRYHAWRLVVVSVVGAFIVGLVSRTSSIEPGFSFTPNGDDLQSAINGLGALVLSFTLIGIIVGGGLWGGGALSNSFTWYRRGMFLTISSIAGALLVGAAAAIVNFMFLISSFE